MRLELHPKQSLAFQSEATEILYGGSAGGGKSHLMRVCAIAWCVDIPGIQVYLFRRTHPDLWKNHMEGPTSFPAMLGEWMSSGFVKLNLSDGQVIFGNGSKIHLCHCQYEKDVLKYQGAEIHCLLIDELTHFTEKIYRFLRGRCRLGGFAIPAQWEGQFPRIMSGANPGGIGHHWVKAGFIDNAIPMQLRQMTKQEGGMVRQFIPARLDDNPTMDDSYADKLAGLGSEALVRAMLDGDWDIVAGAYFTEFSRDRHVVRPFVIPAYWTRYRCFDWGSAKPFACYWLAVSDGTLPKYPRGALIVYREYYGMRDGEPNVGLKMSADRVADEIIRKDSKETTNDAGWGVADPAIFTADGGESIAEAMRKRGLKWRHADNKRKAGWEQVRIRLNGDDDGAPLLFIFETCVHLIRTLPALQHDEHDPEDVDSDQEDHACFAAGTIIDGLGAIEHVGVMTKAVAQCVRLTLCDGRAIVCTPDHLFLTEGGKWIKAESMLGRPLSSVTPFKSSWALDTIAAVVTFSARACDCIASFGNAIMVRLDADFTFTTSTEIRQITTSGILSGSACESTSAGSMEMKAGIWQVNRSTPREMPQGNGTPAKRGESGMQSTGRGLLARRLLRALQKLARFAGSLSRLAVSLRVVRGSAIQTVKPVHCVRVERLKERHNVYCMATREGLLTVQGGVIASNCDALRYGCMARPIIRDGVRASKGPKPGTFDHLLAITDEKKSVSPYRAVRPR